MRFFSVAEALLRSLKSWRQRRSAGPLGDFYRDGGSNLLVSDLPLGPGELVIDAGGYIGEWTNEMLCRYDVRIVVFEPVPLYASALKNRYAKNPRVNVEAFALSNKSGFQQVAIAGEGTTLLVSTGGGVTVELVDVASHFSERGWTEVSCMMMNIEGAEYDVLERLLASGWAQRVRCLLIQFHTVVAEAKERRQRIQAALRSTHDLTFEYPFVWERWDRRGG